MKWIQKHAIEVLIVVAIISLGVSILLPSWNRMRETSGRQRCPSCLHQIGTAIVLYAHANGGLQPDSFKVLMLSEDLTPDVFVCENGSARRAKSADDFVGDESDCSYVYVGDGVMLADLKDAVEVIVAFDRVDNHERDGVNMMFADGHVDFIEFKSKQPPGWWDDMQDQISRHERPVRLRVAHQPTSAP